MPTLLKSARKGTLVECSFISRVEIIRLFYFPIGRHFSTLLFFSNPETKVEDILDSAQNKLFVMNPLGATETLQTMPIDPDRDVQLAPPFLAQQCATPSTSFNLPVLVNPGNSDFPMSVQPPIVMCGMGGIEIGDFQGRVVGGPVVVPVPVPVAVPVNVGEKVVFNAVAVEGAEGPMDLDVKEEDVHVKVGKGKDMKGADTGRKEGGDGSKPNREKDEGGEKGKPMIKKKDESKSRDEKTGETKEGLKVQQQDERVGTGGDEVGHEREAKPPRRDILSLLKKDQGDGVGKGREGDGEKPIEIVGEE
ncbi:hypothetical protein BC829DRAFT_222826 [Chytridium lagenaria]|nr:hypothetical protein BC829DRAFT_222826 [Chytridium lagenaria]